MNRFLLSSNSYNFYKNNYEKLLEQNKQYKEYIKTLEANNKTNQEIIKEITKLDNSISDKNNVLEKKLKAVNNKITNLEDDNIENSRFNNIFEEQIRLSNAKLNDIEDLSYLLLDNDNDQNNVLEENQKKLDKLDEKSDMIIIDVNEYYNILSHLTTENYKETIYQLQELNKSSKDMQEDLNTLNEKSDMIVLDVNEYYNILNHLTTENYKETIRKLKELNEKSDMILIDVNEYFNISNKSNREPLIKDILNDLSKVTKTSKKQIRNSYKTIDEVRYALVFNDTIKNSKWLKDKEFSLNNGASNYSFMYILYRILNDIQPESILEFGLGQTTRMTNQYANYHKINHKVIESDQDWIDVFSQNLNLDYTTIKQTGIEYFRSGGKPNLKYANLEDKIGNDKYDFVIVDGPQGFFPTDPVTFPKYSRSNICDIIDHLDDEFIIVFDDYDRIGEQRTVEKLIEKLEKEKNIKCYTQKFFGLKYQMVILTEKYQFVQWY